MFCPQCGANQSDDLKFCNLCGANLQAVRQVVASREVVEAGERFDWSKTWVAEMFLSESERKRRNAEVDRKRGVTEEVKRYNEIKAGVITSCVGIGVMIFIYFLCQGIILSGQNPPSDNVIISRVWIAGVIPFFIGLGLVFNGLFVSRQIVKVARREQIPGADALEGGAERQSLRSADTTEFVPADFSVTEETTRHLIDSRQKR
jgi:hypothetical protein